MTSQDIVIIGPEVLQRLRSLLPFEKGFCWVPGPEGHGFPPVEISKRQRDRAREALEAGLPFWDMVGSCVIIPVNLSTTTVSTDTAVDGAFVLSGLSRAVGPEEPERWLPLLCSWIESALWMCKKEMIHLGPGMAVPQYISRAVTVHTRENKRLSAIHMKFARGRVCCFTDQEKLGADIKNFLVLVSKQEDLRVELAGQGPSDLWFILSGLDEPALSAFLSRIYLFGPLKKSGIQQVFIHTFDDTFDAASPEDNTQVNRALSEQVTSTEETAFILGMPLFSEALLSDIEGRFSCRGMKQVLLSCHGECKGVQCAVAFAVIPRTVIERLPESSDHFDNVYTAGDGNCVLFMKKASRRERPGFDIQAWAGKIQEVAASYGKGSDMPAIPLGVAASWQQTLKSSTVTGAAFWAYVHAFMLGSGKAIVFDAITWQVRGDELIVSGALRDACRAFRNALKLDGSNAEIWNSLGVCLAQLGRKREAEKAFIAASHRNPNDFMTFYNLCGVQHALKNYDKAEGSCRRSLELRSGDPMILMRLGQVLLDSGRTDDAVKYLEQATTVHSSPPQAVFRQLGIAFYRLNEWPKAKQALKKAVKLKPDDVISRSYLALGYAEFDNDRATARRLAQGIMLKSQISQELRRVSARLGAVLAESSLDKE